MKGDSVNCVLKEKNIKPGEDENKKKCIGKYRQCCAALIVSILPLSNGMSLAWSSPVQHVLQSDNNPLGYEKLSDSEFSWVTSIIFLGGLIGIFVWNPCADKFGRKINGYLLALTQIVGWLGIIFATNPMHLITSRFVIGLGGCGIISQSQLYISETTQRDLKGPLCTLLLISTNAGVVIVDVLGYLLTYEALNIACLLFPFTFILFFFWLPESPLYLSMKNKTKEAEASRLWYGIDEESISEESVTIASYIELFNTPDTFRITLIAIMLAAGQQISGSGIVLVYTEDIVKKSSSTIQPSLAAILIGLMQLGVSCTAGMVVKSNPRKPLLVFSYIGAAFSFLLTSIYFILSDEYKNVLKFLSLIGILCYIIVFNLGIGPLPFVIFPEIFPPRILNHGISVSLTVLVSTAFLATKLFPILIECLGQKYIFLLFSGLNFTLGLCVLIFLPETKNKLNKNPSIDKI